MGKIVEFAYQPDFHDMAIDPWGGPPPTGITRQVLSEPTPQIKRTMLFDLDDLIRIENQFEDNGIERKQFYRLFFRGCDKPIIVPLLQGTRTWHNEQAIEQLKKIWREWRQRDVPLSWQDEIEDGLFESS